MRLDTGALTDLMGGWRRALAHPWVDTFDAEKPRANIVVAILGMALAGLIAGLGQALIGSTFHSVPRNTWPSIILNNLVTMPVLFTSGSVVFFVVARLLGGQGGFIEQTYLLSLAAAPLAALNGALRDAPLIGTPVAILTWVYALIPTTTALQSAHHYESKRALATWGIPLLLFVVLYACVVVWVAASQT